MKLIIDIPVDLKNKICNSTETWAARYVEGWDVSIARIIRNGKPLPEWHGRLIDETKITACEWDGKQMTCNAPTIIEADKGEEE